MLLLRWLLPRDSTSPTLLLRDPPSGGRQAAAAETETEYYIMIWLLAALTASIIGLASLGEQPETQDASVWASASVRNPKQETRVVAPDTLDNPFDGELALGVQDNTGPVRGSAEFVIERESGVRYLGYKAEVVGTFWNFESGWSLADLEDDNVFAHRIWMSKIVDGDTLRNPDAPSWLFGSMVGLGMTRQWFDRWTENGVWMVRASIVNDGFDILGGRIGFKWTFEQGRGRQRITGRVAVKGWAFGSHGQYAFVPFVRFQRIDDGTPPNRWDYQAKAMVTWTPGKGE